MKTSRSRELLIAYETWCEMNATKLPRMSNEQRVDTFLSTLKDTEEEWVSVENVRVLLKKQHRNTRHDAINALLEIWGEANDPGAAINKIEGIIMNLKQRSPLPSPPSH